MDQLNKRSIQEIGDLNDKCKNTLSEFEVKLDNTFKSNTESISNKTNETVQKYQELQESFKSGSKSYLNRKKFIDHLVYINLFITPILFVILSYLLFFKRK